MCFLSSGKKTHIFCTWTDVGWFRSCLQWLILLNPPFQLGNNNNDTRKYTME